MAGAASIEHSIVGLYRARRRGRFQIGDGVQISSGTGIKLLIAIRRLSRPSATDFAITRPHLGHLTSLQDVVPCGRQICLHSPHQSRQFAVAVGIAIRRQKMSGTPGHAGYKRSLQRAFGRAIRHGVYLSGRIYRGDLRDCRSRGLVTSSQTSHQKQSLGDL